MNENNNEMNGKRDLANYRMEKAFSCLQAAKFLLQSDLYENAANRAYYCIYHAIRSVLALEGVEFRKHSGNMSYFREKYIKTGIFNKNLSDIIGSAFTIRSNSDYEDYFVISKQDVEVQVANAEVFYNEVKLFLDKGMTLF